MNNKNQLTAKAIAAIVTLALTVTVVFSIYSPVTAQNPRGNSVPPSPTETTAAKNPVSTSPEIPKSSLKSPPNTDKPTEVSLGFYLINIGRINQSDETLDIGGYLSATWKDPRLAFDPKAVGDTVMRYNLDKIWEPNLTIVNASSTAKRVGLELTVQPDGTVSYVELLNATVSSDLDLKKFPFDSQTVKIVWESLSFDDRVVVFKENKTLTGLSEDSFVSLSEWKIIGTDTPITTNTFANEKKTYARYNFEIKLKRNYQFYIFKAFIPLTLITLISWATFWIDANKAFATQMSLGITSTLTAITFNFTLTNSLPRLPYMTLLDAYIFICYIFFFSAIMANVSLHFLLYKYEKPESNAGIVKKLRWIFPLAFILSQVATITIFLWAK
ncbi:MULTISPECIES: hypothetical protein [unclassified Microcoleus]|uniref:hypothetical protein n=1 Tax=unclassified Microcoleus TaxID=2642155 RepID=UPI002FD7459C